MNTEVIDISSFQRSTTFYGSIDALISIKSFDLQAIRKRYLASRSNTISKTGSVERRTPSLGGIAQIKIEDGKLAESNVLIRTKEPRALHIGHSKFSFAAENIVYVFDEVGEMITLQNPWFSYIHTVEFKPDNPDRLLISSSGFDLILEYDLATKEQCWEWLAWEHGFNSTVDPKTGTPVILTRNEEVAARKKAEGNSVLLISDPSKDSLPTAKRVAFINSVVYDEQDPNFVIATFFHDGAVYRINVENGASKKILDGLKNPHGGHIFNRQTIATSTGTGEVHQLQNEQKRTVYSFKNLEGKPRELGEMEWIQNTDTHSDFFISIDSNRTSFVIFNPDQKVYDVIPFDLNWAVQDICLGTINARQMNAISNIGS
ncbi:MAG: hypothetical protein JJ895_13345 [Balneolaceae bacterium]|nr:hypothetical protein [Balneolaceae bacterium]